MRMLIAEDDPALAGFVKKGLEAEHYAVDVSGDGEQVRALAGEFNYDLVVLDLNLPRLDGVSILRHLRTRKPSVPILILTGRNRVEDRVQCLDLGADDYLVKPFSFSELSARIRALLRRSHLPAESVLLVDDLKLDRVERPGGARRPPHRSDLQGIRPARIPDAQRRPAHHPRHDHRARLEPLLRHRTNVVDVYVNYSTAQVDQRKVGKLALAIQVAFQEMGVFPTSATRTPLDRRQAMPFSTVQAVENIHRTAELARIVSPPASALSGAPQDGDLSSLRRELEQALAPEIARHEVALRAVPDGLVVSLREIGFFESGSAALKTASQPAFDRIAQLLAQRPYRIRVEGHTDNVPIHNAQFASNWELSTARASEVVRSLIVKYGFAPERLAAAGYAQYHPGPRYRPVPVMPMELLSSWHVPERPEANARRRQSGLKSGATTRSRS